MAWVMILIAQANGAPLPGGPQFLKAADFEISAHPGSYPTGRTEGTTKLDEALRFDTTEAAFEFWKTISKTCSQRPDGKPNRPLAAYTIDIAPVEMAAAVLAETRASMGTMQSLLTAIAASKR